MKSPAFLLFGGFFCYSLYKEDNFFPSPQMQCPSKLYLSYWPETTLPRSNHSFSKLDAPAALLRLLYWSCYCWVGYITTHWSVREVTVPKRRENNFQMVVLVSWPYVVEFTGKGQEEKVGVADWPIGNPHIDWFKHLVKLQCYCAVFLAIEQHILYKFLY